MSEVALRLMAKVMRLSTAKSERFHSEPDHGRVKNVTLALVPMPGETPQGQPCG
jgi:hypothetical protein